MGNQYRSEAELYLTRPESFWKATQILSDLMRQRAKNLGGKLVLNKTMIETTDGSIINGSSIEEALKQVVVDRMIARDVAVFRAVDIPPIKTLIHDYELNLHAFPVIGLIRLDFAAPTKDEADNLKSWAEAELNTTLLATMTFDPVPDVPGTEQAAPVPDEVAMTFGVGQTSETPSEVSGVAAVPLAPDDFGGSVNKKYRRGTDVWAVMEGLRALYVDAVSGFVPVIRQSFDAEDRHGTHLERSSLDDLRVAVAEHGLTARWISVHVTGTAPNALGRDEEIDVRIMDHTYLRRLSVDITSRTKLVSKGLEQVGTEHLRRRLPRLRDGQSRLSKFLHSPWAVVAGGIPVAVIAALISKTLGWS